MANSGHKAKHDYPWNVAFLHYQTESSTIISALPHSLFNSAHLREKCGIVERSVIALLTRVEHTRAPQKIFMWESKTHYYNIMSHFGGNEAL